MTLFRIAISTLFLLVLGIWSVSAQGQCDLDVSEIIDRVNEECADIGENEVCYGNRNISVTSRVNTVGFVFDSPGDLADLYDIQSLVVDAVDTQTDTWGVAQMRLVVGSDSGPQDVTMLLFGEFDIENAVEDTPELELRINTLEKIIYRDPSTESAQVGIVNSGSIVIALARLIDSTWLRVEDPQTRIVGWMENSGFTRVNENLSLGVLPQREPDSPYFGAMQAFYFENGNSNIGCDTVASDGLLIQTPEGQARISLLINEVSVELVGGRNDQGDDQSGTAFVQSNNESAGGLSVNVLEGQASVRTDEGEQEISSGQRTTVPLSVDLRAPIGIPSAPLSIGDAANSVNVTPLLPAVSAPRQAQEVASSTSGAVNITGNANNSSSGGSSGGGIGVDVNIGGNNGNNSTNGGSSGTGETGTSTGIGGTGSGGSSSESSSSGGINIGSSSGSSNNTTGSATTQSSSNDESDDDDNDQESIFQGLGQRSNLTLLGLAITAMVLFIIFMIRTARRQE